MPQTFYIENDEEIISVIGRLRKSSTEENYFVFPKRALVLQSIVNLRLFQREAEKLGKKIIIVTQDEAGKVLAEKAGLLTERYTDDFSHQAEHLELSSTPVVNKQSVAPAMSVDHAGLRSKDIGSSDFYTASQSMGEASVVPSVATSLESSARTLRIRNASPEKQTSLNSRRLEGAPEKRTEPAPMDFRPQVTMPIERPAPIENRVTATPRSNEPRQLVQTGREERLRNFFSNGGVATAPQTTALPASVMKTAVPTAPSPRVAVASHKAGSVFLILGGISALSLIGVVIYLFLPKAEVHVVPYSSTQNVDLQFEGTTNPSQGDERALPVRVVEKEQALTLTAQATGTSEGSAQKARGTVTLSNTFGTDAQSLVATTRLEAPDGKIFRLIEGVTIPGMSGSNPGTIEASVMADQTGTEYNIAATTFTIPGFKGGPKYEKFSARSAKAMAGGSTSSGGNQTVISKNDLEQVAVTAKEQAKKAYLESVSAELLPGERVLEENIDIVSLGDASLPLSGTTASSFEYKNTYRVRGFVFSEDTLKQRILSQGEELMSGILFRPVSVVLSYGEAVPDFEAKIVRLKTHAIVTSESVIDREKFLTAILGKDEAGIDAALDSFPEINKIEIVFKPQWFGSSVPDTKSRVTVFVEPGQE